MSSTNRPATGLVSGGLFFFLSRIAGFALAFGISWSLAQIGGSAAWGELAFQIAVLNGLAIFALLGIDTLVVKYLAQDENDLSGSVWQRGLRIVSGSSILIVVCVVLITRISSAIAADSWEGLDDVEQISYALPGFALLRMNASALRARGNIIGYSLFLNVAVLGVFSIFLLIARLGDANILPENTTWLYVGAVYISLAVAIADYRYRPRHPLMSQRVESEISYRDLFKQAAPLLVVSSMAIIMFNADLLVLDLFEEKSSVGAYDIAFKLAGLVGLGLAAINTVAMPQFSSLFAEGKLSELSATVRKTSWVALILAIPPVVIVGLASDMVLRLYGDDFVQATQSLRLLLAAQLISAFCGPIGALLQMTGNERRFQLAFGMATAVNVALNFALVPSFGMDGAAIASLASTALWNVWATKIGVKTLGFGAVFRSKTQP